MDAPIPISRRSSKRPLILISAGAFLLALFVLIAIGVNQHILFVQTDVLCKDVLHRHASESPAIAAAFKRITELGSRRALLAEGAAVLLVLMLLRKRRAAALCGLGLAGNGAVPLLKLWFGRTRPVFVNPIDLETTASFPSGHAVGSAIIFGMLAYICITAYPRRWLTFVTLFGSLIVLIGFSRVYLGVHWLSDVIAGQCFGLGWVLIWVAVAEVRARPHRAEILTGLENPSCHPNLPR